MEDIDTYVKKIEKLREDWMEEQTDQTATELQWQLSKMKLMIGIQNFNELYAFEILLDDVTNFLKSKRKNEIEKNFSKKF